VLKSKALLVSWLHSNYLDFKSMSTLRICLHIDSTGESLIIRRCVLENMENQCGRFKFEGEILRGCVLTCYLNGCNGSETTSKPSFYFTLFATTITVLLHRLFTSSKISANSGCYSSLLMIKS